MEWRYLRLWLSLCDETGALLVRIHWQICDQRAQVRIEQVTFAYHQCMRVQKIGIPNVFIHRQQICHN